MATPSAYNGGGVGAGGKFRKKPFRRPATPYERPSVIQSAKNVFKSKLVDPASRILARSAHSIFASLFRKRLTAPPLVVSEPTRESRDEGQQAITMQSPGSGAQDGVTNERENRSSGFGNSGINEIEEALKQKTFTKAEIDRLTELLQSRTVTVPAEKDETRPEPTSHVETAHYFHPLQVNKIESQKPFEGISSSAVNSIDVASPAELARVYMGIVPVNASPSNIGLRSQASRKDTPLPMNGPYTPKSSGLSLGRRFATGVSENGYSMQRPRGRSAIYNMARTPTSRVYDTTSRKNNGYGASSSSQWSLENNMLSSGKQAPKRRSSILDSDIGSGGPIRRIRQKTSMMSPQKDSTFLPTSRSPCNSGNADGSDIAQGSRSVMRKQMFLNGPKDKISNIRSAEIDNNGIQNSASVPPRSSEMAGKILQQLDKLVSSPKEKLSELKLAVAREKSPMRLTHNMLHGKALRSLEDIDSSKLLQTAGNQSRETRDSTSSRQDKFDNGGQVLIAATNKKFLPKENGLETGESKENTPSAKTSDSGRSSFVYPSPEKRAFRMSAQEDFLDMDDDSDNGGAGLTTEKVKLDGSLVATEVIAAETGTSQKNSAPSFETKVPTSTIAEEDADIKVNIAPTIAENGRFIPIVVPASSTLPQSPFPQAPLFSNGAAPPKEIAAATSLTFGSQTVDEAPFAFSSKFSGVDGLSNSTLGAQLHKSTTSTATVAVTSTDTLKVSRSDENDNSHISKDLFGWPENIVPQAASTSASMKLSPFGPSTLSPKVNDKPHPDPSPFPTSTAQVPNTTSDGIFSAAISIGTTSGATSTCTSTKVTTSTNPSISAAPPLFSAAPTFMVGSNSNGVASNLSSLPPSTSGIEVANSDQIDKTAPVEGSMFKFGSNSNGIPPSSVPSLTSGIESTHSEAKDKAGSSFVNLNKSPFVTSSTSEFTSMGSSVFGFSASTTSSTSSLSLSSTNQSLSSNPFGTVGSLFGTQGASTETKTGVAPFTHSMPNQFGLSASSSTAGQSAASSLSSGSSLITSATPVVNPFGSSSVFGLSSSTSLGATSVTSTSRPSLFSSSLPSGSSSVFGSGFGSSTSAIGFSFGASSATTASAVSPPMVFGSSLGSSPAPIFSFSSTSATTSLASLPSSQTVFSTPSPAVQFGSTPNNNDQMGMEDSMAEDTVQSSNPTVSAFGQPANTPPPVFGQPANTPPPGNFIFGSGAPSGASPFQFGGQQNLGAPQNPFPFQAAGNSDISAGGSFSLGTGGGDKANRKIFKARRDKTRKR